MRSLSLAVVGIVLVITAAFTLGEPSTESSAAAVISAAVEPEMTSPAQMAPPAADTITEVRRRGRYSRWNRRAAEVEAMIDGWVRPDGPIRVALQAGHWKSQEAPDEQSGLRGNGTRGGGKLEWEVNLEIARHAAEMLEREGYIVEVLPTTIPPGYWADVFVSIHADGNNSASASGYRAAAPRRDYTGRAAELATLIERSYGEATGLRHYPTTTRRMTGYYAFNSRRYEHSLHPMTTGVILETGFLTSPNDRRIIVEAPDRAARGIAEAITTFLEPLHAELGARATVAASAPVADQATGGR